MVSDGHRLLCVFAHPDDESYGPGGTIAKYAAEGVHVYVLVFTCGEAGSIGISKDIPDEELCRIRTAELADACRCLGVEKHRVLGVPDGRVGETDEAWAVKQIVDDVEAYRPQVLLTFHHRGISGHADHIAVAEFVARAYDETGKNPHGPRKLYEFGIKRDKARLYQRKNLVPLEDDEINAEVDIPDDAMERKLLAIRRHRTQYDFFLSMAEKFDYRAVVRPEYFFLRKTRLPRPEYKENHLFAGIP